MTIAVKKYIDVDITAEEFINGMDKADTVEVLSAVAEKFDQDFKNRNEMARVFSEHLSENTARFLAEVVTHHFMRN